MDKRIRMGNVGAAVLAMTFCLAGAPYLAGCGGSDAVEAVGQGESVTQEASRAAEGAAQGVDAVTAALEPLSYLAAADEGGTRAAATRQGGDRPRVDVIRGDGSVTVTIDYGPDPVTTVGGRRVSGAVAMTLSPAARTASVAYSAFTVNGRSVTGTVALSDVTFTRPGIAYTAAVDLTFAGFGRVAGTVRYERGAVGGGFAIPTADLTVTPNGGTAYAVTLTGIAIDPTDNGNFIPQAGTARIAYTATVLGRPVNTTLVLTYTAESPQSGVVQLSVNGAPAVPYTLPRFP